MRSKKSILVVDDDVQVRQALGEVLETEDYCVDSAANSVEALDRFGGPRQHDVDVVILDLHLGKENGWELFDRLTTVAPNLPVILISASRGQRPPPKARPFAAILEKPLNFPVLFNTLHRLVAKPTPKKNVPR